VRLSTYNSDRMSATEGWQGWDTYAAFYDWENAQTVRRRDVAFWQRLSVATEGRILELGCGTGRISLPIARNGASLIGIDRSEPMLERARRRIARARIADRVRLTRGDIRFLPFRRSHFRLVMAPYGVLQSLTRERDLTAALGSISRVLSKGGRLAIDLVPDLPRWSEYSRKKALTGRMGRHTAVTLIESVRQDRHRGLTVFDQHYTTVRDGRLKAFSFSLTFRTVSVPQMTRRLERAGFRVDAVLGDYRGGPWDSRADVWVILATRR
jgi:ubiquinone/menaquinone biosynthesis C-methylase UbiE